MNKVKRQKAKGKNADVLGNGFRTGFFTFSFLLFTFSFLLFTSVSAQEPSAEDTAPPPLKRLSEIERNQLYAQPDVKKRTKLSLELIEARIKTAENLSSRQNFDEMFRELGGFHALMDDTLEFLHKSDRDSNKVLYNFKKLEIGLRKIPPRLEVIRRDLPIRYEYYVRVLIRYIREARAKAIEPLFDDTVLPDKKP